MRSACLTLLCVLGLLLPGVAQARVDAGPQAPPAGLRAFLLRAEEPVKHEFSRTPSFAWSPVPGAVRYEFELATSKQFPGAAIIWSNVGKELDEAPTTTTSGTGTTTGGTTTGTGGTTTGTPTTTTTPSPTENLRAPTISVDVALPWITGAPYALYAHVRAITRSGPTPWSKPFGFNVRWAGIPRDLDSPYRGLVRWSPVEGATSYEVWLMGGKRIFTTTTNVADARELFTLHRDAPQWTTTISFRVRAKRTLYGEVASGLPTTTYGPWSPVYSDPQPPQSLGDLISVATISDTENTGLGVAHSLTPGFVFGGQNGGPADVLGGAPAELFRVYVATDKDCVNIVYRGAIVGSPAYAPRLSGPLALPQDEIAVGLNRTKILDFGTEGDALMLDGSKSVSTEVPDSGAAAGAGSGTPAPKIDLPDTAWPSGGYYWTVVPVHIVRKPDVPPPASGGPGTVIPIEYRETELPQDACQAGRLMRFGKTSPPVVTSAKRPFVSGLSPNGRLVSANRATPAFYGTPLVAWEPALGAQDYEVQWSRSVTPFKPVGSVKTGATSALLPLTTGTWFYRVRGFNPLLPKRPQMAWSAPIRLKVAKPVFKVVKR